MPKVPEVLHPRRKSRQIRVGKVLVGGDAPISVQSMTTTPTTNINATLQQIAELTASGCDIVRVAVPSRDDAEALPIIAKKSQIPVIADIHFQPNYVYAAIDAGCAAVRVNPGNIRKFDDQVGEIARRAKEAGVSLRIGVNAGSLEPRGVLVIDAGAVKALHAGRSLLAAGVTRIEGAFARGDAVVVRGPEGHEIGRGLVAYGADNAERIKGKSSAEASKILGLTGRPEMIHRDDLVVSHRHDREADEAANP